MAEPRRICDAAMVQPPPESDLAIVGAGVAGCSLVTALRWRGWSGSITLLESGRGPGGRAATRRSRIAADLRIDHGAPLFNLSTDTGVAALRPLLEALQEAGWIRPCTAAIHSLDAQGQIGSAPDEGFHQGELWQGCGGMDQLATGLLALGAAQAGDTQLRCSTVVRHLDPSPPGQAPGWTLRAGDGTGLVRSRWLVLSGTLLTHPRSQQLFGWDGVPLQRAAAARPDPQLDQATAALARSTSSASSHLLLQLPAALASSWQEQPWRVLQFNPEAQQRWGLRRVTQQRQADGSVAVVAESSSAFADRHRDVYGSRSSAAQLLGAAPDPEAEAAVIEALNDALNDALGLPTAPADRQLMRWGAAFPQPPGLPAALQLCPSSHIGFCGDYVASAGFGRIEGALLSAHALAEQMLPLL